MPISASMLCSIADRKARASPSSDGREIYCHKSMGHVADIFTPEVVGSLPGDLAIGHTRYSTAGDTVLRNAQPFSVACNKGQIAVAHNGNITNAGELRRELEREGSIFQASSDTEVILHLVARSRERTLAGALCARRCCNWKAHFRWCSWRRTELLWRAIRMDSVRWRWDRWSCPRAASRTCLHPRPARSILIDAVYMNDVEPGEMVIVGPEGVDAGALCASEARRHCVFEHVYFSRPDSIVFGRSVQQSRETDGSLAGS